MTEITHTPTPAPGAAHKRLAAFIGKWINEGHTIASGTGRRKITALRASQPRAVSTSLSSIYPEVNDTSRAWITCSGYKAATASTAGDGFSVNEDGIAPGSGSSRTSTSRTAPRGSRPTGTATFRPSDYEPEARAKVVEPMVSAGCRARGEGKDCRVSRGCSAPVGGEARASIPQLTRG